MTRITCIFPKNSSVFWCRQTQRTPARSPLDFRMYLCRKFQAGSPRGFVCLWWEPCSYKLKVATKLKPVSWQSLRIGVGTEDCHCITAACVNALAIRLLKVAACDKMAGLAQEKASALALLQKRLQQPIHNFDCVQMIACTFVGVFCIAYIDP